MHAYKIDRPSYVRRMDPNYTTLFSLYRILNIAKKREVSIFKFYKQKIFTNAERWSATSVLCLSDKL